MSLRLTISHRDAFVRAVMQDYPKNTYEAEIIKLLKAGFPKVYPASVKTLIKNNQKHYLKESSIRYSDGHLPFWGSLKHTSNTYFRLDASSSVDPYKELLTANDFTAFCKLMKEWNAYLTTKDSLRQRLHSGIYGANTLKQALEIFPEFEKYLPTEEGKMPKGSLPAVANIFSDLVKAGWPTSVPKVPEKDKAQVVPKITADEAFMLAA